MNWLITPIAFVCEYLDSTLGGGFGTILTPVLILMGYSPMQIVPVLLASEIMTGILAGILHHKEGNVDFRDKAIQRLTLALTACSIAGTITAVVLALKLPKQVVSAYISWMVTIVGMFMLFNLGKQIRFSRIKIILLGIIASFNKAMSGGGYGPVMMGGQILSGVKAKHAIGVTSMAEGFTCLVGLITYCMLKKDIDFSLLPYVIVGSLLSVPFTAKSVKVLPERVLKVLASLLVLTLGLLAVLKISNP